MSQAGSIGSGGSGGSGIQTINGDIGSVTGSIVTLFSNTSALNCGSSVSFVNSGTTSTFNLTDSNSNTIIGRGAGNATLTGENNFIAGALAAPLITSANSNCIVGYNVCAALQDGLYNTFIGTTAGNSLVSGQENVGIGYGALWNGINIFGNIGIGFEAYAGGNYTGSEAFNIVIGSQGVTGDNHVIRIGEHGTGGNQQSTCFIAGIQGVTTDNPPNFSTVDPATGQLGDSGILSSSVAQVNVANASRPGFLSFCSTTLNDVTGDGTPFAVIFDTEQFDNTGSYDNTTGIWTTDAAGIYQINVQLFLDDIPTTAGDLSVFANFSSSIASWLVKQINPSTTLSGGGLSVSGSLCVYLAAATTVQVFVSVDGITKSVDIVGASGGNINSSFSAVFIG